MNTRLVQTARMSALLRFLVWCLLVGGTVYAHDPGLSTLTVTRTSEAIAVTIAFNDQDGRLLKLHPMADASAIAPKVCSVLADGAPLALASADVIVGENNDLVLRSLYTGSHAGRLEVLSKAFEQLPRGHRQFASIKDAAGIDAQTALLNADHPSIVSHDADHPRSDDATATAFFVLGIEHILTGYDHLLFLFALLLVCADFRAAAVIITCFTLAHSFTLALAALQIVNLPSQLVEVVIAASIVYVGAENLLRKKQYCYRWLITIAFGLIHGLGFASVLRETALGSGGKLIASLVSFNLGVETGQILIAAIVLPILFRLRERHTFQRRWAPAASALICVAGSWWIVDRMFLSN